MAEMVSPPDRHDRNADSDELANALIALRQGPQRLDAAYHAGRAIAGMLGTDEANLAVALRQVHQRTRKAFGRSSLYRALHAFEVCELNPAILHSEFLTVSHVTAVLHLDPPTQTHLLSRAELEHWTVRRLKHLVDESSGWQARTGRPKSPRVVKTLRRLAEADQAFDDVDALLTLDPATATRFLEVCRSVRDHISRAERSLEKAAAGHSRLGVLLVDPDRTFALRAQRQLRAQATMIRIVPNCTEALQGVASDTACAIINLYLPDGCGLELSTRLADARPDLRFIFITSRPKSAIDLKLDSAAVLVEKTSGLRALKTELVKALSVSTEASQRSAG